MQEMETFGGSDKYMYDGEEGFLTCLSESELWDQVN